MSREKKLTYFSGGILAIIGIALGFVGAIWWPWGGHHKRASNSPVVVRGGAMTFRAPKAFAVDKDGSPCLVLGNGSGGATITVSMIQNENNSGNDNGPTTLSSTPQIDFFGHPMGWIRPDGSPGESDNGVQVTLTKTCNSSKFGIKFSGETSQSDFYPHRKRTVPDEDQTFTLRFRDRSCNTTAGPNGDEDNCEHLSNVYIHGSPTSNPKSETMWKCIDGECEVRFTIQ